MSLLRLVPRLQEAFRSSLGREPDDFSPDTSLASLCSPEELTTFLDQVEVVFQVVVLVASG